MFDSETAMSKEMLWTFFLSEHYEKSRDIGTDNYRILYPL